MTKPTVDACLSFSYTMASTVSEAVITAKPMYWMGMRPQRSMKATVKK